MPARHVPLEKRLEGKRVCVCVGAGGVGKTTVSAALALGLAARGRKVVVVSIDPARRLAAALGLRDLDGEPHRIERDGEGELWAMMLDSKGTFDALIARLAPDERTREEILSNRIYRELSTAVAGSQEFTAVAKLYELHKSGEWDTIVLDTPPSREALDFLDAPDRLTRFLEGRALRTLLAAGGVARAAGGVARGSAARRGVVQGDVARGDVALEGVAREGVAREGVAREGVARGLLGRGTGLMFSVFARVTGVNLLGELSAFFASLAGVLDGFRDRARGVERLLRDPATDFLIVTSPEREPTREAAFLHARLARERMGCAGLVVNRVHERGREDRTAEEVAQRLSDELGETLAARVRANLADFDVLVRRDRESVAALCEALGEPDPLLVGHLDGDVQDLAGLAVIAERLLA